MTVEEALTPEDRRAIERFARIIGITAAVPITRRVVSFQRLVEMVAVERLADGIDGGSRTDRVARACLRLGIPYETHKKRMYRALEQSFDPSRSPGQFGHSSSGPGAR